MENGLESFLMLCLKTHNKSQLSALLDLFLSPEEKNDLANRYLIVKALLIDKKPQRMIAKELGVSIAKITRGSNAIKRMSPDLLKYLTQYFAES